MTLLNVKFSLSLRILGLDHYQFPCSRQAFAYIVSRNLPFDPIHLFTRALLNSHWFCHYNEHHFVHACLIIKYHMQFLWQAFQNMRLMHKYTTLSHSQYLGLPFWIPLWFTSYFSSLMNNAFQCETLLIS